MVSTGQPATPICRQRHQARIDVDDDAIEGLAARDRYPAVIDPPPSPRRQPGRIASLAYRLLGMAAFGLAVAGVILPGLPATPFLLVAAWAFARGSPKWAARIERHPRLGPLLRNWRQGQVVPRRAKILAVGSMAASLLILWASEASTLMLAGVGTMMLIGATYLLSRPERPVSPKALMAPAKVDNAPHE
jgi:uncharacterized membrane protein YbaN (DUF454 family)